MKFPYRLFRDFYYPIVPVIVTNKSKSISTSALVDSGASISIFNGSIGKLIGIDVESGEKRIFQGVSARLIGYVHKVRLEIAGIKIECGVVFSNELGTSFNLIGRRGVFDKFLITFNESAKEMLIENA